MVGMMLYVSKAHPSPSQVSKLNQCGRWIYLSITKREYTQSLAIPPKFLLLSILFCDPIQPMRDDFDCLASCMELLLWVGIATTTQPFV